MLFRTHFVFGFLSWIVLEHFLNMPFFVLGFVLLGSVLVDVDSLNSKVGRKLWFLSWLFNHRGVLHSWVGCFAVSLGFGFFSLWAGFGVFVGYISHLFLDLFTKRGVGLFWPFNFRVRGFVRSGSWVEDIIFSVIVLLAVLAVWFVLIF